jgi:hypothetical protein
MGHALEVYSGETLVFSSDGTWIYPLFELERFLAGGGVRPQELLVCDRVVGRAAALVMVFLGVGRVRAGLLSQGGRTVLERHGVPLSWERVVERIGCQTEELLATEEDPERAWRMLRRRAGLDERAPAESSSGGRG